MGLRKRQKVRLGIERLEERDVPSQLGQVVTLPQAAGHGQGPESALTAPADHGRGVTVMLKIDASLSSLKY
jgi:hypothetical protein